MDTGGGRENKLVNQRERLCALGSVERRVQPEARQGVPDARSGRGVVVLGVRTGDGGVRGGAVEERIVNADFFRAVILKVAFKPEPLRRAQAALLYAALSGETFTADVLPGEICDDNTTAGCAVGALATAKLLERVDRVKSPAKSRHGAWVNRWRLAEGKRETAKTWLTKNGFDATLLFEPQQEFQLV